MKNSWTIAGLLLLSGVLTHCTGQVPANEGNGPVTVGSNAPVGGGCDGCELMFIGMPNTLSSIDTSPGWTEAGQKLLVTGTVFKSGGQIPAPGVVVYYWQTDHTGHYAPGKGLDEQAKRHGHIRGWVRTDEQGKYTIYTIRPAPYPGEDIPAHIHTSIKEPAIADAYYIDEFVFDDDPLLTTAKRRALENRGGSGIIRVLVDGDLQVAEHNIILGLNIPGYPDKAVSHSASGLEVGQDNPSFTPFHAFGPDKGSKACPVCKYGRYNGILYFVGDHPEWDGIKEWLLFLEKESAARGKFLKAYFIYGDQQGYDKTNREAQLEQLGATLKLRYTALTFVPSFTDTVSDVYLNKIDPEVQNTFILYKNGTIMAKFVDLGASAANFQRIQDVLNGSQNDYFKLPRLTQE